VTNEDVTLFTEVDRTDDPDFFIRFLDQGNANPDIQKSKRIILDGLRLREGLFVLDVGCGTGADVVDIARRVASSGAVTGVDVSEAMIAEFVTVIPQTPSLVLITYRPEYRGAMSGMAGAHTVALAPLTDSETTALVSQLLGHDPSTGVLGQKIAERAAGNPFFAEEIVRELAERGVLRGEWGAYLSAAEVGDVSVPVTLQAAIAARIDRLDPKAKRTLNAAAVIGSGFGLDLLETLGTDPALEELIATEFIDQITFTRQPEYVFHHPLIRTVAYESQLKSDRAELHGRIAAAIESRDPAAADENAALLAEHLEAAGDLYAAYGWHMRAATWATSRDITAAYLSWQRAIRIADALPVDDPNQATMRIAPRTMLCGNAWRVHEHVAGTQFEELRQLCTAAGDKASPAIAMAGLHRYVESLNVSLSDSGIYAGNLVIGELRRPEDYADILWNMAEMRERPSVVIGDPVPVAAFETLVARGYAQAHPARLLKSLPAPRSAHERDTLLLALAHAHMNAVRFEDAPSILANIEREVTKLGGNMQTPRFGVGKAGQ